MKNKMTKKRALELLEKKFGDCDFIRALCLFMPEELRDDFREYWSKINTDRHISMYSYFGYSGYVAFCYSRDELSILRLLTAFFFIEDTYK